MVDNDGEQGQDSPTSTDSKTAGITESTVAGPGVRRNEQSFYDDFSDDSIAAGQWEQMGRGTARIEDGHLHIEGCFVRVVDLEWEHYELRFCARSSDEATHAEIWAGLRAEDRWHRYMLGLRGGDNEDLYLARHAEYGRDRFLCHAHLDEPLEPAEWHTVRIRVHGDRFQVYLDGEDIPRLDVADPDDPPFTTGSVILGGGYLPTEFDWVEARKLDAEAKNPVPLLPETGKKLNFQPSGKESPDGFTPVTEEPYTADRDCGWTNPVTACKRGDDPVSFQNTLVRIADETRKATFTYDVSAGYYRVTLIAGDPEQSSVGSVSWMDDHEDKSFDVEAGQTKVVSGVVDATESPIRVGIQRSSDAGVSINGIAIEELAPETAHEANDVHTKREPEGRRRQRENYEPVEIDALEQGRTSISLDGAWLFRPDYEQPASETDSPLSSDSDAPGPSTREFDDQSWHIMDVPNFWTPAKCWLNGETYGPYEHDKGQSDGFYWSEQERVDRLTFDGEKTQSAWYRQHIEFPAEVAGKRVELDFDAISKVSAIYVNGEHVTDTVGMFRPSTVDITEHVSAGENVVAVHVSRDHPGAVDDASGDDVVDVAVTVPVTKDMVSSLPHGFYRGDPGGIWQPVELTITDKVSIDDVWFRPRLDGANIDLSVENENGTTREVELAYEIRSSDDESVLTGGTVTTLQLDSGANQDVSFDTPNVDPELWSPDSPSLYTLEIVLTNGGKVFDSYTADVGFRTFEIKDGEFYLNGRRYWLRGANHIPIYAGPNDDALASDFLDMAADHNVRITRTHTVPGTETWLAAADRQGMLISYEGTWPWLMIDGPLPSEELRNIWEDECTELIQKYRNHPSVVMWTVNNEMKFYHNDKDNPERLEKKTQVLNQAVNRIRDLDPSRPVVVNSDYTRALAKRTGAFDSMQATDEFDDGDVDDMHGYYNWYGNSFFQHFGLSWEDEHTERRPLISQEMSSGYPRSDDGRPTRYYTFDRQVPQAWVGDWAYEHRDPAIFLERLAMMVKELAECFRCIDREHIQGIFHFSLLTWVYDMHNAENLDPMLPLERLATAHQPVLVRAELYGRHYFAGSTESLTPDMTLVNDSEDGEAIPAGTVRWRLEHDGDPLSAGSVQTPCIPYYESRSVHTEIDIPDTLPEPRVNADLVLELEAGEEILSVNRYELVLAERDWATTPFESDAQWYLFDQSNTLPSTLEKQELGAQPIRSLDGLSSLGAGDVLVVGPIDEKPPNYDAIRAFAERGGHALLLQNGSPVRSLLPEIIEGHDQIRAEVTTMRYDEHPIFKGIEPNDPAWFDAGEEAPFAATGKFQVNRRHADLTMIADYLEPHFQINSPEEYKDLAGLPVFGVTVGDGHLLVSEMRTDVAQSDPIAGRILRNALHAIGDDKLNP